MSTDRDPLKHYTTLAAEATVGKDLLLAAIQVWAACRNGTEPDLIELADCIDAAGGKELRKAALAGSTP